MQQTLLVVDKPKRSQNNCGKFIIPYDQSKNLNYGKRYMVLVVPLSESEYKYKRFKGFIEGLTIKIKGEL